MEDNKELEPSADFVKGYNEGYTLAQYMPDLAQKLEGALQNSDRSNGFKEGKAQFDYELTLDERPKWMGRYNNSPSQDQIKSRGKDKDDIEHDKD